MARILIVDDDVELMCACKALLERHGHAVSTSSDAERGDSDEPTRCPSS